MTFLDVLPILIIALIVGGAIFYIVREKMRGKKCIGCPYCDSCSYKNKGGSCASYNGEKENDSLQKEQ